jgi:TRAP-type C4-dicarboxylate transport system substrate-binding protein
MRKYISIFLILSSLTYGRKIIVKMATLAPKGTDWHGMLIEMGQEWKKITKGKVQLKIYPGGIIGDERDMVRKMRIGQIHAAGITAEGLSEITPEFGGYFVPLAYQSTSDVKSVTDALMPQFNEGLNKSGFKMLHLGEVGWVYWFSKFTIKEPDDLRRMKFFTWAGDFKWEQAWKKAGFNPVALASTDIISSLQTGLINTIPTMPIYALAQQSFGIANQMLNLKWGVLMAGIVIDLDTWNRIPEKYHGDLIKVVNNIQTKYSTLNLDSEKKAISAMQKYGLTVHEISDSQKSKWFKEVDKIEPLLRGSIIPENIYDTVIKLTNKQ